MRTDNCFDELVITRLDRLGRSARDLHDIADELVRAEVRLNINGMIYDPTDPMGKMFFGMLVLMAEFEAELIRARTREGMAEAKKAGRLKGKQPKLSVLRRKKLLEDYESGEYDTKQLCEIAGLSRSAMYATLQRAREDREQGQVA
nr:recombinase family protein [Rhodococcus sp. W8901]